MGVRSEKEDGEAVEADDSEADIKQVLGGRPFMNIKSIQRYLKEESLPTLALEQRKLRQVLERMVAKRELEMKISNRTGNRLYRLM